MLLRVHGLSQAAVFWRRNESIFDPAVLEARVQVPPFVSA